jgi:hypothetical protein
LEATYLAAVKVDTRARAYNMADLLFNTALMTVHAAHMKNVQN